MTHYDVLGIPPTATLDEIRAAYRKLAQDYHPDKNAGATDAVRRMAEEQLKAINAAYETLKNPQARASYDAELGAQPRAQAGSDAGARRHSQTQQAQIAELRLKLEQVELEINNIATGRDQIAQNYRERIALGEAQLAQAGQQWEAEKQRLQAAARPRRRLTWLVVILSTVGLALFVIASALVIFGVASTGATPTGQAAVDKFYWTTGIFLLSILAYELISGAVLIIVKRPQSFSDGVKRCLWAAAALILSWCLVGIPGLCLGTLMLAMLPKSLIFMLLLPLIGAHLGFVCLAGWERAPKPPPLPCQPKNNPILLKQQMAAELAAYDEKFARILNHKLRLRQDYVADLMSRGG